MKVSFDAEDKQLMRSCGREKGPRERVFHAGQRWRSVLHVQPLSLPPSTVPMDRYGLQCCIYVHM